MFGQRTKFDIAPPQFSAVHIIRRTKVVRNNLCRTPFYVATLKEVYQFTVFEQRNAWRRRWVWRQELAGFCHSICVHTCKNSV